MRLGRNKEATGLEIDAGRVRAARVRHRGGQNLLAAYGEQPLPPAAVTRGRVNQPEVLAAALAELWDAAGLGPRQVVLGIAGQEILFRLLRLPQLPKDKLAGAVRYAAQDIFPLPAAEVTFDFATLGTVQVEQETQLEILVVGTSRELVDHYLQAVEMAGLIPLAVEPVPLAAVRAAAAADGSETTVVVYVAADLTSIVFLAGGKPRFARILPGGWQDYPCVAPAASEAAATSIPETGRVGDAWTATLTEGIASSIRFYFSQPGATDVNRLLLAGPGAIQPAAIEKALGVPVITADPLLAVEVAPALAGKITGPAPQLAACIGLALRGLQR